MIEQKPLNTPGYTLGDYQTLLVRDGQVIGLVTQEYADEVTPRQSQEGVEQATSQQGINQTAQPDLSPEGTVRDGRVLAAEAEVAEQGDAAETGGAPDKE